MENKEIKLEKYINKAKLIHNNKYDYSKITLEIFTGTMKKYEVGCPIHGFWYVSLDNHIIKKSNCPKCKGFNLTFLEKIEQAKKIHNERYDYSLILKDFNTNKKVPIICKIHGQFKQLWTNHVHQSQGCPECKINRSPILIEEIKERILNLNTGLEYDWDSYFGYFDNRFRIKCQKHGWFNQQVSNHLQGQRCKKCNNSKGEENIEKFLLENSIDFITQKSFENCINPKTGKKLRFDFYLPKLNTCIEYDGELHYISVKYFGGEKEFERIKEMDLIKNEFCKKEGINLLRISYLEFKNIIGILKKQI